MTPAKSADRDHHLQHILGALYGALALGMVVATVLGVWLDAPGGPVRLVNPDKLTQGGCARPQTEDRPTDYIGTPCDDPDATVLVLAVVDPVDSERAQPHCPLGTDRLIEIYSPPILEFLADTDDEADDEPDGDADGVDDQDAETGTADETEWPEVTEIACARNLSPSHPGDAGAGGGQLVAGDCGYIDDDGNVAETGCAGGDDAPTAQFQIVAIVEDQLDCPEGSTEKYEMWADVTFGEDGFQLACAVPVSTED